MVTCSPTFLFSFLLNHYFKQSKWTFFIEPEQLHGEINGFLTVFSSEKQILHMVASEASDYLEAEHSCFRSITSPKGSSSFARPLLSSFAEIPSVLLCGCTLIYSLTSSRSLSTKSTSFKLKVLSQSSLTGSN